MVSFISAIAKYTQMIPEMQKLPEGVLCIVQFSDGKDRCLTQLSWISSPWCICDVCFKIIS